MPTSTLARNATGSPMAFSTEDVPRLSSLRTRSSIPRAVGITVSSKAVAPKAVGLPGAAGNHSEQRRAAAVPVQRVRDASVAPKAANAVNQGSGLPLQSVFALQPEPLFFHASLLHVAVFLTLLPPPLRDGWPSLFGLPASSRPQAPSRHPALVAP